MFLRLPLTRNMGTSVAEEWRRHHSSGERDWGGWRGGGVRSFERKKTGVRSRRSPGHGEGKLETMEEDLKVLIGFKKQGIFRKNKGREGQDPPFFDGLECS